jgi:hypothetical protein
MKEKVVRKNGTKDSTYYMETWRFKNNKLTSRLGFCAVQRDSNIALQCIIIFVDLLWNKN